MRVLLVHNRYRIQGGEERSVELQLEALRRAGVEHALLERRSADLSRSQAALALLRGGRDEDDVKAATRELDADVVHVHNMLPLPGPRGLEAARAGRRVRAPAPPQPAALLRDRRGRPRRRPLLSLPPPQHAAGACPQLPRLAARGSRLRGGARQPPADRLRDGQQLRGAEQLRRRPVRAAGRAGGPDRGAAALPARRGVRRAQQGGSRAATRSWPPGSRPRRASTPPSRQQRPPAYPCGWRARDRPRRGARRARQPQRRAGRVPRPARSAQAWLASSPVRRWC